MDQTTIFRARDIARSLGVRKAAGYLRNRGATLSQALVILVGRVNHGA